jgi:hypothetical protein
MGLEGLKLLGLDSGGDVVHDSKAHGTQNQGDGKYEKNHFLF